MPQEVGSRTERFSRVVTDTHTDRLATERQATNRLPSGYRPTDRQADRPTDRQTGPDRHKGSGRQTQIDAIDRRI